MKEQILLIFILSSSITLTTISSENIPISNILKTSPSCTIFTVSIGNTVLFGNNEDYLQLKSYLWYVPSQNISVIGGNRSIYGGVFIGYVDEEIGGLWPQGGMNEHGLMYDGNGLPPVFLNENPNGSSFYIEAEIVSSLWDCRNVEEVIEWFKIHKWNGTITGQLHYGDASGEAVVVSVNPSTNKWAFTRKTGNYIVSTNFNLNDTDNSYSYPCGRYLTATRMLNQIENEEDLTIQACADVLYAVHQEGMYRTIYSNIFDPVNLNIYFNYGESYQKQKKVNLLDVLNQESSFEKLNITENTGVESHILIKSVEIDDQFYFSSTTSLPPPVYAIILALCVISITLRIYIYKKKVK
ncbi:MAG: hypothetical protein ACFFDI_29835 [Promethearchaeota archaeon]